MTDQKIPVEKKKGINPVAAAVTGAVVGAGLVVAGAAALSDKKNRDKAKQVLGNVKDKATTYMKDMKKEARDKKDKAEKKLKNKVKK